MVRFELRVITSAIALEPGTKQRWSQFPNSRWQHQVYTFGSDASVGKVQIFERFALKQSFLENEHTIIAKRIVRQVEANQRATLRLQFEMDQSNVSELKRWTSDLTRICASRLIARLVS